jgi:hypothetical protein
MPLKELVKEENQYSVSVLFQDQVTRFYRNPFPT